MRLSGRGRDRGRAMAQDQQANEYPAGAIRPLTCCCLYNFVPPLPAVYPLGAGQRHVFPTHVEPSKGPPIELHRTSRFMDQDLLREVIDDVGKMRSAWHPAYNAHDIWRFYCAAHEYKHG